MTEAEYLSAVAAVRQKIDGGTEADIDQAAVDLEQMSSIRPWRLEYIYARIALMLKKGENKRLCRLLLEHVDQEFQLHSNLEDRFSLLQQTYEKKSLGWRASLFSQQFYASGDAHEKSFSLLRKMEEKFLHHPQDMAVIKDLAEHYYIVRNNVMYFILMMAWCHMTGKMHSYKKYLEHDVFFSAIYRIVNSEYLSSFFNDGKYYTFVLVDDFQEHQDLDVLALALRIMGHTVYMLRSMPNQKPDSISSDFDSVSWCLSHGTQQNHIFYIPILRFITGQGHVFDNRLDLVMSLSQKIQQDGPVLVFAADDVMDVLHQDKKWAKNFQRLTNCQPEQFHYVMSVAWAGNYLKYIDRLYGFSSAACLQRDDACEISVVIPVRNNAETLRYTLATCLNQRFSISYEIVLSDNSDPDNYEIYNLYSELQDEHIHYYRTPHVLSLTKSFEFAFLHARGSFVFSIGADDGIFPWTMRVLHEILPHMGDRDILSWNSGAYIWPQAGEVYKRNALNMPLYDKSSGIFTAPFALQQISYDSFLTEDEMGIYNAPMLYMNSGFRRSYLQRMLKETGRLWDGCCQDTAMGMVNFMLNDMVLYTPFPLVLTGISSHSIGARGTSIQDDLQLLLQRLLSHQDDQEALSWSSYVERRSEFQYPSIARNGVTVFKTMLRLQEQGLLPEHKAKPFPWQDIYSKIWQQIDTSDVLFELRRGYIRYAMHLTGQDGLAATLEKPVLQPVSKEVQTVPVECKRQYYIGVKLQAQRFFTDASLFNIHNIKEAVDFLVKLTGL